MNNKLPLVSIVVITYNSAKTILETLNSIKNQTYKNIELIVSDDCSKDNTLKIIDSWIKENEGRFIRTIIIKSDYNTGTAGNCNRGYNATRGMWIKCIAGDDILMDDCINSNVNYILRNKSTEILLSKVKFIGDSEKIEKHKKLFNYGALNLQPKELLYLLMTKNFLPASTLFINKKAYKELKGFDESIPLLEDWPFWIKALYNKKHISFNNDYTVYYRMTEQSISLSSKVNPLYTQSLSVFYNKYLPQYQWNTNKLLWVYNKIKKHRYSKNSFIKFISFLLLSINPITYYLRTINNKAEKLNLIIFNNNE